MKCRISSHRFQHASEAGDQATLNGMVMDDFQFLGVTPQPLGKAEFLGFIESLHTAFPDFKFNETSASESGDTATIKHKITGTHTGTFNIPGMPPIPATGKSFALPEEGDQVVEVLEHMCYTTHINTIGTFAKRVGVVPKTVQRWGREGRRAGVSHGHKSALRHG